MPRRRRRTGRGRLLGAAATLAAAVFVADALARRGERAPSIASRAHDPPLREVGAEGRAQAAQADAARAALNVGATDALAGPLAEAAPAEASPTEAEHRTVRRFASSARTRFVAVGKLASDVALEHLPPAFCELYPDECATLRLAGDAPLATALTPPDEAELAALCSRGLPLASIVEGRELQELFETIRGFYSREKETARGALPPISLAEHLGPQARMIDERLEHPAETWALLDEYERYMIDAWARREHADPERDDTAIEADLHALFWEHRCRLDNAMIAALPPRVGFWFHLGRVLNRVAMDDSYWMPADELAAVYGHYPDWLR